MSYAYNRRHRTPRGRFLLTTLEIIVVLGAVGIGLFVWLQHQKPKVKTVSGASISIPQTITKPAVLHISEPSFTMQLPADWKQATSVDNPTQHYVTWQGTGNDDTDRSLTIYIDIIPTTTPVNRELPLTAQNNQLSYGQISDNCSGFTPGGTQDVAQAEKLAPAPSVWQGVNFICNLPRVVDNQTGSGSSAGINTVVVNGPKAGSHKYFFLYTDRNIHPDDTILYNAIQSFRAV